MVEEEVEVVDLIIGTIRILIKILNEIKMVEIGTKIEEGNLLQPASNSRCSKSFAILRNDAPHGGRGDEWSDPWMRKRSPARRSRRSHSSSYSSSRYSILKTYLKLGSPSHFLGN
jgi:hypothetical protein